MKKLELAVYDLVKADPRLKRRIRDTYQRICDLIPVKRSDSAYEIGVREGFFFGFHDKCPWSADDQMLLGHRFSIPLRMPKPDESVEVGYFYGPGYRDFQTIGSTSAWNWHQGAMLQWLGSSPNIIFNDFDGKTHASRVLDNDGHLVQVLPAPIGAVSPDGTKALSYSFARLRRVPYAYSYANGDDPEFDCSAASSHGLHLIDIPSGRTDILFSVADIAAIDPVPSMRGAFHYFTHCQFSPSGKRFKFFHRWLEKGYLRWTRMISCDLAGANLHIFPTAGMVSHVAWKDAQHVLAYARTHEFGDKYYLFTDQSNEFVIVGQEAFSSDGHPSFSKDAKWMLTDTYPDRFRTRYLIVYDLETKKRYNLAKLYSPREYVGATFRDILTCDLHPRWNRGNTMICFDSAHTGVRALCTIEVGNLTSEVPRSV